jgi:hypothetical protein
MLYALVIILQAGPGVAIDTNLRFPEAAACEAAKAAIEVSAKRGTGVSLAGTCVAGAK